eukprot:5015133-Amphidinium_carterae.1
MPESLAAAHAFLDNRSASMRMGQAMGAGVVGQPSSQELVGTLWQQARHSCDANRGEIALPNCTGLKYPLLRSLGHVAVLFPSMSFLQHAPRTFAASTWHDHFIVKKSINGLA